MRSVVPTTHVAAFTSFARATSRVKKATLFLFSVAVLLAGGAAAVRGQSALDGFDPNANGTVHVVVVQPDGKILIGGEFTTLSPNGGAPVTRNRIARLNPDGSLDTAFDPNASGTTVTVYTIAVQADGKILAGGYFNSIGGQTRNNIARLNPDGTLDTAFDPNAAGLVRSVAVQADGKILAGGYFNSIGGQTRNNIARLDGTTGLADSFNPNANDEVQAIAVQADGKILAGGFFMSIGGQPRHLIARLNTDGTLDTAFNPNPPNATNTQPDGIPDFVYSIAVQADGKVLVGGYFSSIGGQPRNSIARLDGTTGLVDSFNPNGAIVYSIAVQADGKILVGGYFTSIGGQPRHKIARLDATTGLADSFDPNASSGSFLVNSIAVQADGKVLAGGGFTTLAPNGGTAVTRNRIARLETDGRLDQTLNLNAVGNEVAATVVQPDGKILIGGYFTTVLGVTRHNIARLNTDGTLDMAFDPNANGAVYSIAVQADGKILLGGRFSTLSPNGGAAVTRNLIARLNPDGTLDTAFNPNAGGDIVVWVDSIAVQTDGKILVGGFFTEIGGQLRNFIARLDATTGAADSFNPNANSIVYSIAVQADGKILVGGYFSSIGGQPRNNIARLDATTGLADSFDPNANNDVRSVAVQVDGKILAGGEFTNIGGQPRNRIARLDATTGLADSFDPNASNVVYSIAVQADGKILAGGAFTTIGGQARNRIARLDPTTGFADSFNPNADSIVYSIAVQVDGKILAGGAFTTIDGQPRYLFARLSNDTAALQDVAVTRTAITWTRGGSSAQFTRVTFESSTDNVNYTPLGNGIPQSGSNNWNLTGLSLSTGQNIYIRARGCYRSGWHNGSESLTESVRNAFIPTPPTPTQIVSRKVHGSVGPFDINLPLTGTPGIESRSGGATNDYTMVATFASAVTVTGNPQAQVTSGTGDIGSGGVSNGGMVTISGNTVTVPLTNVSNAQTINVTLNGVNGTGNVVIAMSVLIGDTNANGAVNAGDAAQTKARIGQPLDATNFRSDVNANGAINASDVSVIKSNIGTGLP